MKVKNEVLRYFVSLNVAISQVIFAMFLVTPLLSGESSLAVIIINLIMFLLIIAFGCLLSLFA
jgi:hypothetical protein